MKAIKYLFLGALMLGFSASAMAQDRKADIAAISKVINDTKGNAAAVKEPVKQFLKTYKKDAVALAGLGRAFLDVRDTAQAKVYADMAMQRGKNKCVEAYLLEGDIEAVKDDGGAAASWYHQATQIDPNEPMGYIKYARVYRKISPTESAEMLERLRAARPDYPVDAVAAHFFFQANNYDQAVEYFAKANRGSLNEDNLKEYALAAYYTGQHDKSLEIAKYGLEKFPRSAVLNRMAFYNSLVAEDYNGAISYADKLMNQSDSAEVSPRDYLNLGYSNLGAKSWDAAISAFQQSLQMRENPEAYKALAQAYSGKGAHASAVEQYNKYLATVSSPKAEDYTGLADIYQAIASDENTEEADTKMALRKADEAYAKVCEMNPTAKFYVYKRAQINAQLDPENKEGLAKPYYERLISLVQSGTQGENDVVYLKRAYRYMAIYYYTKQDLSNAKSWAQKLIELEPDNDVAKQILAM